MEKIKVDRKDSLYGILKKVENVAGDRVFIEFTKESSIYKNSSNLKALKAIGKMRQKEISFGVINSKDEDYIDAVNNDILELDDSAVDLDETKQGVRRKVFPSFFKIAPTFSLRGKKAHPIVKTFTIILGSILLFFGLFFVFWLYIPTSNVKLIVSSEVLVKLLEVKAVVGEDKISVENSTIPAFSIQATESDFKTIPTTGTKEVGKKAKGKVSIYNKTDKDIKLSKGTLVKLISTEDESLKYEILDDLTVPAKTEETSTTDGGETTKITYGVEEVSVAAKEIGDKYNIKEGQKFEVDGYDTDKLLAENDSRIDGGSSKTVNVVLESDLDELRASLDEFMQKKVFDSLNKKVVNGQKLLKASVRTTVDSASFDKKVGDEASNVTLKMTVTGTGLAYSEEDLDKVIKELVKVVVPETYSLEEERPEYEVAVSDISKDSTQLTLQVKLRSNISPKIDKDKIASDLAGMKIPQAEEYLSSLPNIKGYEIGMSPKLPPILQGMPRRQQNITVKIVK